MSYDLVGDTNAPKVSFQRALI